MILNQSSSRHRLLDFIRRIPGIRGLRTHAAWEMRALFNVIRSRISGAKAEFGGHAPAQRPLHWTCSFTLEGGVSTLSAEFSRLGIHHNESAHAIYVPPQAGLAGMLGDFVCTYPKDAGFKILKNHPGDREAAPGLSGPRSDPESDNALVGTAWDLIPAANFLYERNIAPRLYDITRLHAGQVPLTALVVQHISGAAPSAPECRAFLSSLRHLLEAGPLVWRPVSNGPHGSWPDADDNLVKSAADGRLYHVSLRNFSFGDLATHLDSLLHEAKAAVHFGFPVLFRGGRHLYQQVPGWSRAGKRDTSLRWQQIKALLAKAGIAMNGRVVLDVGCNAGMMIASALQDGALWGVGWDRPQVVQMGTRLLATLGYTRFNLVGANLCEPRALLDGVPAHLAPHLDVAILFHLAMRPWIGFPDGLSTIPWLAMVYEGHERESLDDLPRQVQELQDVVPCDLIAATRIRDGDCRSRPLALLLRRCTDLGPANGMSHRAAQRSALFTGAGASIQVCSVAK